MRRKQNKTVTIHGWTGEGRTLTDAKADAIAKIERAATMRTAVHVVSVGEELYVISPDHTTGTWSVEQTDLPRVRRCISGCTSMGYRSEAEAVFRTRCHAAQLATDLSADFWETLSMVGATLI